MKLNKKISVILLSVVSCVILGASGNGKHKEHMVPRENVLDSNLNVKMVELKHKFKEQKAGITEATEMFKKVFNGALVGSATVENIWFANGNTSVVILDSPIPIRILFKGQFLVDNQMLQDKVGKSIKFKVSDLELVEEPIIETLRLPFTDSKFWIHATFSNYGKVKDGDFIDNIKTNTIPY